jgi:hypothetical protein
MTDLDAIRERHRPGVYERHGNCAYDGQKWPCEFAVYIDGLEEAVGGLPGFRTYQGAGMQQEHGGKWIDRAAVLAILRGE